MIVHILLSAGLLAVCSLAMAEKEECGEWQAPLSAPEGVPSLLEMRKCDLMYGLSAYVEIRNTSDKRLQLSIHIITKKDESIDSKVIAEPLATTRPVKCQDCAERRNGFKAWEIVDVTELPAAAPAEIVEIVNLPKAPTAPVLKQKAAKSKAAKPKAPKPVIVKTPPAPVAPAQPTKAEAALRAEEAPKTEEPVKTEAPPEKEESVEEVEGFKTEDGTIIPYDQLPPEFRPRN